MNAGNTYEQYELVYKTTIYDNLVYLYKVHLKTSPEFIKRQKLIRYRPKHYFKDVIRTLLVVIR